MKTVFITITRGILMRNILRSKAFEIFKQQKDLRIVVLIQNIYNLELPEYLVKELGGDNIIFEFVPNQTISKLQRGFNSLTNYLVFTDSSKYYLAERPELSKRINEFSFFFFSLIYKPLSKFNFLKKIARKIDLLIYKNEMIAKLFDKYNPNLVFSTAILSGMDFDILKEAKKRKIKTISMPKSWDNLDRILFRVEPDIFLVQNENMKEQTVKHQAINPDKIKVVGFPQFDIYKEDVLTSKEAYCEKKGLDSNLPILFLGSEGIWSEGDERIFEEIILCRERGEVKSCNIVVRPHFSIAHKNTYEKFRQYKNICIDNFFRKSNFFGDKWDPTREDQIDLTNLLYHCSALITFASTLALDSACFNKPVIAVAYGINFKNNKDITEVIYKKGYYEQVAETGAPMLVYSKEELVSAINQSIENPYTRQEEVRKLRKDMCGAVDGGSGERIARFVFEYLYKQDSKD
ncbi:CDP-glycerol glycerophosphotransferase family protein [Patescibacteria group bacterium]|nr:CDP-glycerol glycerophosphotransferase family protein [Patescibacteria group bacterium]